MTRLIGDIGGTNARFALAEPDGSLRDERHLLVRDHPDLASAAETYLGERRVSEAVIAVRRRAPDALALHGQGRTDSRTCDSRSRPMTPTCAPSARNQDIRRRLSRRLRTACSVVRRTSSTTNASSLALKSDKGGAGKRLSGRLPKPHRCPCRARLWTCLPDSQ